MSENTGSAAVAFDALRKEVSETRTELSKLAKAIERPVPDYNPTLGAIAKRLGGIEADLARWEEHLPPIALRGERYTPHELAQLTKEAKAAASKLREATRHSIGQQTVRWWMAGMFGFGAAIGIMLFIGIANLLPSSAGAWMAASIFGGDPWSAGQTLMRQADPVSFERMVELYRACPQNDSVGLCRAAIAVKAATVPGQ
jgi:hypothetical protein